MSFSSDCCSAPQYADRHGLRTACPSRRQCVGPAGRTTTLYDNQGQAYCTRVLSVNPISGAVDSANYLETDIYHDGRGDVVATLAPGGLLTTASFDGAGRVTLQASGNASGTPGIIGTVVQSVATQYDGDCNPIFVTTKQLNPDGTTYWTTYVANWYNAQDQVTTTANYGH